MCLLLIKCAIILTLNINKQNNCMVENIFIEIIRSLGLLIEYLGLFFIVVAVFIAIVQLPMKKYKMQDVRASLAKKIIFGLEFVIAADILLATVATDFGDILQLGGIVLVRIMLGYALRKEIMG